ncbi:MAG: nucleotidyltransferase domain-containing protein [Terriglobia bacterium]|nr:nucleotidyltransferase domain-containing protein [Terriglobia bacterium]
MEVHSVEDLAKQLGADWPFILRGRENSRIEFDGIKEACKALVMPDTSLVVFGSLARGEFTDGSDIDWTLLVDGITIPQHLTVARQISEALAKLESKEPGRTGTFGNMASSHSLIHCIGGEDDTNTNTTRRSLLLLEARPVGDDEAFNRVRNNILKRYLEEDLGLWRSSTVQKVPHFLLNDFARYWRTMAVDFADKQHDRFHEGFALRNIKLRLSRKLLYISGLLACFRCQLDFPNDQERIAFFNRVNSVEVASYLRNLLDKTPLDLTAETLTLYTDKVKAVGELFGAYEDFLGVLSDKSGRTHLEALTPDQLETDAAYASARAISHRFAEAVQSIFLNSDNRIGELTIRYGVF